MTDRQIRCFLALYETLNFSAAARQLFLTQPTLSYQIRTLEEELGTPLFTRTTCRVEPTEAGQLFAAFAQNVRQSYQAFQHALAAGPARREKLVLQVPVTMASRDLVYHDLLMALSQELPDCDLEVRTDTSCTSPEEVLQSGVDALIQQQNFQLRPGRRIAALIRAQQIAQRSKHFHLPFLGQKTPLTPRRV